MGGGSILGSEERGGKPRRPVEAKCLRCDYQLLTRSGQSIVLGGHSKRGEISVLEGLPKSCGLDP